eukprot:8528091-Pyramimonas_sp.AAC.1
MRILSAVEMLAAQGFPVARFGQLLLSAEPRVLADMAGNAMTSTVVFAVFCAMYLAAPWRSSAISEHVATDEDACNVALIALASSAVENVSDSE